MLNKDFDYLINILDSIEKIEQYSLPLNSADELYKDAKSFDAILMNFIIIGEMLPELKSFIKKII